MMLRSYIPRASVRPLSYLLVGALFLGLGSLASHSEDPRVFVGTILFMTLLALVTTTLLWFLIGMIIDKRRERLRFERQESGLCVVCGYDLRVHSSENCPECGMPISRKKSVQIAQQSEVKLPSSSSH